MQNLLKTIGKAMNIYLSPFVSAYQQNYSTKKVSNCLLEESRVGVGNNFVVGGVFMDLSVALDCIFYGLLISKLSAHGFDDYLVHYIDIFSINIFHQTINTLSTSDVTKITTELILLPIITEIMQDKIIETIRYIKSVGKKNSSVDRIKTHLLKIGDGNNAWSIEKLLNLLQEICDKGFHGTG